MYVSAIYFDGDNVDEVNEFIYKVMNKPAVMFKRDSGYRVSMFKYTDDIILYKGEYIVDMLSKICYYSKEFFEDYFIPVDYPVLLRNTSVFNCKPCNDSTKQYVAVVINGNSNYNGKDDIEDKRHVSVIESKSKLFRFTLSWCSFIDDKVLLEYGDVLLINKKDTTDTNIIKFSDFVHLYIISDFAALIPIYAGSKIMILKPEEELIYNTFFYHDFNINELCEFNKGIEIISSDICYVRLKINGEIYTIENNTYILECNDKYQFMTPAEFVDFANS